MNEKLKMRTAKPLVNAVTQYSTSHHSFDCFVTEVYWSGQTISLAPLYFFCLCFTELEWKFLLRWIENLMTMQTFDRTVKFAHI